MYIPNTQREHEEMLEFLGLDWEKLFGDIPQSLRLKTPLEIEGGLCEMEVEERLRALANKNHVFSSIFRGAGAYWHYIPPVVDALASRGEFVTAYTPYQAEMSQGILQSIFEYQTMICMLTGMEVSNASVYDGASAAGEAALLSKERQRNVILVADTAPPQVIETIQTYIAPHGMCIKRVMQEDGVVNVHDLQSKLGPDVAAVYIAQPNYYGNLEPVDQIDSWIHEAGAKYIVGVNPISLGLLEAPGVYGADIVVGEGQPLGLPLAFGGPYLGFMACTKKLMRKLPGRIVGETVDTKGKRAFVLTLQAREQHIRREKAGSNICSNQAWCALRSAIYLSTVGRQGLAEIAAHCYANAHYLAEQLARLGFVRSHEQDFFHEFVTKTPLPAKEIEKALEKADILSGLPLGESEMLWCATERTTKTKIDALIAVLREALPWTK